MDKLGRSYSLFVQNQEGDVINITPPLTLEFDISRQLLGSANHGAFRVFNLDRQNRNSIRFNNFNFAQYRSLKLYAGYGKNLSLIFSGNIHEAWSVREGVNFITQVECFDGGFGYTNSPFEATFPTGTDQVDIIRQIVTTMNKSDPSISVGVISNSYSAKITRSSAANGYGPHLIDDIANGGFFIDNGKVNCLKNNECLQGSISVINAQAGLLGTPLLEQGILMFDMIFEPRLVIGQLIQLESSTDNVFNGVYKITSVKHRGMISDAVCGDAVTSVQCLTGINQFQLVS